MIQIQGSSKKRTMGIQGVPGRVAIYIGEDFLNLQIQTVGIKTRRQQLRHHAASLLRRQESDGGGLRQQGGERQKKQKRQIFHGESPFPAPGRTTRKERWGVVCQSREAPMTDCSAFRSQPPPFRRK